MISKPSDFHRAYGAGVGLDDRVELHAAKAARPRPGQGVLAQGAAGSPAVMRRIDHEARARDVRAAALAVAYMFALPITAPARIDRAAERTDHPELARGPLVHLRVVGGKSRRRRRSRGRTARSRASRRLSPP